MTKTCPCCGSEIEKWPVEVLAFAELTKSQLKIMDMLLGAYPKGVPRDRAISKLYDDDPDGGPLCADAVVRTQVKYMNPRIAPFGFRVVGRQGMFHIVKLKHIKQVDHDRRRRRVMELLKKGCTYSEIARRVRCTRSAVSGIVHREKAKLKAVSQ